MENYLYLFEKAIKKQAEIVGQEAAWAQAKKAGLGVSKNGQIVSCFGNPQIVLLKLIKFFTAGGNMLAMVECTPLINELLKGYDLENEIPESIKETAKTN